MEGVELLGFPGLELLDLSPLRSLEMTCEAGCMGRDALKGQ